MFDFTTKDVEYYLTDSCYGENAMLLYNAILEDDKNKLELFSKLGNSIHNIVQNYDHYLVRLKLGFPPIELNEYGWMKQCEWLDVHKIDISVKNHYYHNAVHCGMSPNGKWAKGMRFSTGNAGRSYGINDFGDIYNSKDDALLSGLKELLTYHEERQLYYNFENDSCGNFKIDFSKAVVKQIRVEIANLTAPQLTLF